MQGIIYIAIAQILKVKFYQYYYTIMMIIIIIIIIIIVIIIIIIIIMIINFIYKASIYHYFRCCFRRFTMY